MKINEVLQRLYADAFTPMFEKHYGGGQSALAYQKERYINAVGQFVAHYPQHGAVRLFSAPGRTEIGGNHTDHQHGCVLGAAVSLDNIAVVAAHDEGVICIASEGYESFVVSPDDLSVGIDKNGSAALVRGIVKGFTEMGVSVSGFDAYVTSDVPSGSGISSSAAFEMLIGTIINSFYNNGKAEAVEIARIGQYAENVYFGKSSGLMDQAISSSGGLVAIDFADEENPQIRRFPFTFEQYGYCLCITDTKGSHADLTEDYGAIRAEMESVAAFFGKAYLRDVDENAFYNVLPEVRKACSDRAILRASHFFSENRRAQMQAAALERGDIDGFLELVRKSGESSACLLQNLYSIEQPAAQGIPLGIMLSKRFLRNTGAVRVHGGGFAGTIQAFVPIAAAEEYAKVMDRVFGEGSCMTIRIRQAGGVELTAY